MIKVSTPKPESDNLGMWNVYVCEGKTKDDRNARLSQAPENLRPDIIKHVTLVFKMRA